LDNVKLENLRAEVIALEHKQAKTISKEQEKINTLERENNMLNAKLTDMTANLNIQKSEIKRLKEIGKELKDILSEYTMSSHRKEFIESIKF
jgi:erythromycin esterase-like protein